MSRELKISIGQHSAKGRKATNQDFHGALIPKEPLLSLKGITWAWFEGGFAPTTPAVANPDGSTKTPATCTSAHIQHQYGTPPVLVVPNPTINPGADIHISGIDYSPHHQPFQCYASGDQRVALAGMVADGGLHPIR